MKRITFLWLLLVTVSAVRIGLLFDDPVAAAAVAPDRANQTNDPSAARPLVELARATAQRSRAAKNDPLALAGPARSVELALAELTRLLETPVLGRTRWELAARGLSASLGPGAAPALLEIVRDRRRSTFDLVAAAELLRRVDDSPEVPRPELARLRQVAFGGLPDSACASAARRVVAQLGDWSDRLTLVRELDQPTSAETRIAAAWSLQAATSQDVLPDLAEVIEACPDPRAGELAVLVIESILRRTGPLQDDARNALAETIVAAVEDPEAPPALAVRVVALLGALGGDTAQRALTRLAVEGPAREAAARALSQDEDGQRWLMHTVTDQRLGDSQRLAAASALLHAPRAREAVIGTAVDGLRAVLETADSPDDRRRAVLALADCTTDASRLVLEHTLLEDADAGVRAAAVIAMTRFDERERFQGALETCARSDASEGVRELATRVLE